MCSLPEKPMVSVRQATRSAAKPGAIWPRSSLPRLRAPPCVPSLSVSLQLSAAQHSSSSRVARKPKQCPVRGLVCSPTLCAAQRMAGSRWQKCQHVPVLTSMQRHSSSDLAKCSVAPLQAPGCSSRARRLVSGLDLLSLDLSLHCQSAARPACVGPYNAAELTIKPFSPAGSWLERCSSRARRSSASMWLLPFADHHRPCCRRAHCTSSCSQSAS